MNEDDTAPQWHSTKAWSHGLKTKIDGVFGLSMERMFLSIERQFEVNRLIQSVGGVVDSWPVPVIKHPLIMSSMKNSTTLAPASWDRSTPDAVMKEALPQAADYADRCGADEAHILVFDRRANKPKKSKNALRLGVSASRKGRWRSFFRYLSLFQVLNTL